MKLKIIVSSVISKNVMIKKKIKIFFFFFYIMGEFFIEIKNMKENFFFLYRKNFIIFPTFVRMQTS